MLRRAFVTLTVACLIGTALTACGSSSNGSSGSGATSASGTAGAATTASLTPNVHGAPLVIGTICSCTGPSADALAPTAGIMKAWVAWTNAHGGVNGHPVKDILIDDGQDAARSLQAAKQLVEQDHVMAIVSDMSTADAAFAAYVTKAGVPVVGGDPYEPTFLSSPDFFPSGGTLIDTFYGLTALAKQHGAKKLGVLYCAEAPVCAQIQALMTPLSKAVGIGTYYGKVSQSAPNYLAPCLALKGAGVDALFAAVLSSNVVRLSDGCAQQGYHPLTASTTAVAASDWLKDPNMDGAILSASNLPVIATSNPDVQAFQQAIAAVDPGLKGTAEYGNPNMLTWAGAELFKEVGNAGHLQPTSSPADVMKAVYALHQTTIGGLAPPLIFTPGKPTLPGCYFVVGLKGGQYDMPKGTAPQCIPAPVLAAIAKSLGG